MTGAVWSILAMGAGVYAIRLSGLLLRGAAVPLAWEWALGFVPVALLSALVVTSLVGRGDGTAAGIIAATGAAAVAWRTRRMWACIAAGIVLYQLLRLV